VILYFFLACMMNNSSEQILTGQIKKYYYNSTIKEIISYKNNKKNGIAYYFYKSGSIQKICYFKNDTLVGPVDKFYDDSIWILKSVCEYKGGKLISKKRFDSLEQPIYKKNK
jgi:antitoxin component YwqK of YwqJK toxin-antitoxin module